MQMLSGTAPRAKSGAKASGNCEDGPRAITGADKAEKANHNPNPRPRVHARLTPQMRQCPVTALPKNRPQMRSSQETRFLLPVAAVSVERREIEERQKKREKKKLVGTPARQRGVMTRKVLVLVVTGRREHAPLGVIE